MKYAIYIHKAKDGGVAWEVWTTGGKDDHKVAGGVGFDVTQALLHAGAWIK